VRHCRTGAPCEVDDMWLIRAHVIDVEQERILTDTALEVKDGRITAVEPEAGRVSPRVGSAEGEEVLDLAGAYLAPGIISCHTHLSIVFPFSASDEHEHPGKTALRAARRAGDALRAGVTTVRTCHENHRIDIALRDMIAGGWAEGPRIVAAGRGVDSTGGHGAGQGCAVADGAAEFLKAARAELAAGANHVKIFLSGGIAQQHEEFGHTQVSPEEIAAAVYAAESHGTYVTAHAGDSGPINAGLDGGVRCYEHGYRVDDSTAARLAASDAWLVPTLTVSRAAPWMRRQGFEEWTIAKALDAADEHMESTRRAVRAGVNIANGTDAPPGDLSAGAPMAICEAENLVEAGLTPAEALRASTLDAARLCNIHQLTGRVEADLAADLIAIRENPLEDIRALRSIFMVMSGGRIIRNDHS